ncbi:MAG: hypothetical protein LBG47_03265 [Prevotellaceae bacterium]|jgi:hypothetical protein|nr:hypothetical protein [Prevotellaceae bacterium]
MAQIFMIYAAEEPERSGARRSQMAKICANHKNLRHLRAKKQSAALDRGEYKSTPIALQCPCLSASAVPPAKANPDSSGSGINRY